MSKRARLLWLGIGGAVLGAIVVIATLWIVLGNNTRQHTQAVAMTPQQVVTQYQQKAADFLSAYTVLPPENLIMQFKVRTESQYIEFPATNYLEYKQSGTSQRSFEELSAQTLSILQSFAFTQQEAAGSYVTYQSPNKVCQLQRVTVGAAYAFGCMTRDDIDTKVGLSQQLLAAVKVSESSLTLPEGATLIIDEVRVDNTIRYATMSFASDAITASRQGAPRLLFGNTGSSWEYVANLNNTAAKSDGRQRVSDADRARLNDAKWKGALSSVY